MILIFCNLILVDCRSFQGRLFYAFKGKKKKKKKQQLSFVVTMNIKKIKKHTKKKKKNRPVSCDCFI